MPGVGPKSPADNDYKPGFAAELMLKDLRLSQQAAEGADADTPMGELATQLYGRFVENEDGRGRDFSAMLPRLDALSGSTAVGAVASVRGVHGGLDLAAGRTSLSTGRAGHLPWTLPALRVTSGGFASRRGRPRGPRWTAARHPVGGWRFPGRPQRMNMPLPG